MGAHASGSLCLAHAGADRADDARRDSAPPHPDWVRAGLAVAASIAAVAATWRLWSWRAALAVWGAYLALLAPVVGLFPSGLQVTADRYTYGPAMVLSVALALALSALTRSARRVALVATLVAAVRPRCVGAAPRRRIGATRCRCGPAR